MASKDEIQALLRFLAHDAKLPLQTAMSKISELQKASLASYASLLPLLLH